MDDQVERLHLALAAALRRSRPQPFSAPVTVAEVYQDLVPYRAVRATVGFEMNADYEHALLQLLAGVGGCARIEPERAGAELREELTSPNPNVGLFRKFAACELWVNEPVQPERTDEQTDVFAPPGPRAAEPALASEPETETVIEARPHYRAPSLWRPSDDDGEADAADTLHENARAAHAQGGVEKPSRPRGIAPPVGQPEARPDFDARCGFCDSVLPAGRIVRFCPHCGADQALRPCSACAEPLDSSWEFCIACGASQGE